MIDSHLALKCLIEQYDWEIELYYLAFMHNRLYILRRQIILHKSVARIIIITIAITIICHLPDLNFVYLVT
jgi:hypothetical protein